MGQTGLNSEKNRGAASTLAGMTRCAVPVRVQRVERILEDVHITAHVATLTVALDGAARRPYLEVVSKCAPFAALNDASVAPDQL